MISLVEDGFFDRGWCNVEAALVQILMRSYGRHRWYEHRLLNPQVDRISGVLRPLDREISYDVSRLKVTLAADKPKIEFLLRQSKLLGRAA